MWRGTFPAQVSFWTQLTDLPALSHSQEADYWKSNSCKPGLKCIWMVQEDATEHIAAVLNRIKPEYLVRLLCLPMQWKVSS